MTLRFTRCWGRVARANVSLHLYITYCLSVQAPCKVTRYSACSCTPTSTAQLVEHRTGTLPTQASCRRRFDSPVRQGIFLPESTFSANPYGVPTPPCAIACIYTCAHVKYPQVLVRVQWIVETLKHPACTAGWVARLCRSWLSPGKATRIFHERDPIGAIQL